MHNNDFAEPTFDRRLSDVFDRVECKKHGAIKGLPCWLIMKGSGFGYFAAACNSRLRKAGMAGRISPQALNLKHRGGNRDKRR